MKSIAALMVFSLLSMSAVASPSSSELREAIRNADISSVKKMIDEGLDIIKMDQDSRVSVLDYAVMFNQPDILNLFIQSNPKIIEVSGDNALVLACATNKRNLEIINSLINNGVDINAKDRQGQNCLYSAALSSDHAFFEFLISNGADPEVLVTPSKALKIKSPISVAEFVDLRLNAYREMQKRITGQTTLTQ